MKKYEKPELEELTIKRTETNEVNPFNFEDGPPVGLLSGTTLPPQ